MTPAHRLRHHIGSYFTYQGHRYLLGSDPTVYPQSHFVENLVHKFAVVDDSGNRTILEIMGSEEVDIETSGGGVTA